MYKLLAGCSSTMDAVPEFLQSDKVSTGSLQSSVSDQQEISNQCNPANDGGGSCNPDITTIQTCTHAAVSLKR